jgi:hypothetical protein
MKEKMQVAVSEGQTLQLHSKDGPVGQPVTVPQGVSSLTVIIRDAGGSRKRGRGSGEARTARRAARKAPRGGEAAAGKEA